jgi:hypothetical protein
MALTFDEALLLASRTQRGAQTPPGRRVGRAVDAASQHVTTDEKEEQ